jgi:predicted transcriptional regulator
MSPPHPDFTDSPTEITVLAVAVEEARADVQAGRVIPYEDVRRWLLSWGTEHETPSPECK